MISENIDKAIQPVMDVQAQMALSSSIQQPAQTTPSLRESLQNYRAVAISGLFLERIEI